MAEQLITLTLAGATGSVDSEVPLYGYVEAVSVVYNGQSGTCNFTLKEKEGMQRTILGIAAANTNTVKNPLTPAHDATGTVIASNYTKFWLAGTHLTLAVTGGSVGSVVVRVQTSNLGMN